MAKNTMGSLSWGLQNKGALNSSERLKVIKNLAFLQSREVYDRLRYQLGILKPAPMDFRDFELPDSAMVSDAVELAEEEQCQALFYHCWRTYYFAALIAQHDKISFDAENLLVSSMLHDIGLTDHADVTPLNKCCFAVSGGAGAKKILITKGYSPEISNQIGEAISLHLNLHVPRHKHGEIAYLLARGACCDVFGAGVRRIHRSSIETLLQTYPRDGVEKALGFGTADHMPNSRAHFMGKLFGGKSPPTPF
ncbi:MAG: hypothetical protein MI743_00680 [Sneathiellales bacterium]|nr:hypothetical protein [Sneathiellales bacterium]